jgi:hypothetical protein
VSFAEKLPKVFKDDSEMLGKLIEMVFFHMVDIETEIDEAWQSPREGFNEDVEEDADQEVVRFGTYGTDRLISAIGQKVMLPTLTRIV